MARPSKFAGVIVHLDKIEKLAMHGFTNEEIADFLSISRSTFQLYLVKHKEFSDTIKNAKLKADLEVEVSLFKRAKGYDYVEEHIEYEPGKTIDDTKIKSVKKIKKHVPADPFSATVWLNNRRPEEWKRNRDSGTGLNNNELNNLKQLAAKQSRENL